MLARYFLVALSTWSCAQGAHDYLETNMINGQTGCQSEGAPVCASNGDVEVLFPNECFLEETNRENYLGQPLFKKIPLRFCVNDCQLSCSPVYQPICGFDPQSSIKRTFINNCEMAKDACLSTSDWVFFSAGECGTPAQVLSREPELTNVPMPMLAEVPSFARLPILARPLAVGWAPAQHPTPTRLSVASQSPAAALPPTLIRPLALVRAPVLMPVRARLPTPVHVIDHMTAASSMATQARSPPKIEELAPTLSQSPNLAPMSLSVQTQTQYGAPIKAQLPQEARKPALPPTPNQARMSQEARKPAQFPAPNQALMSQEARKPAQSPAPHQAPMPQKARELALPPAPNQARMSQEATKPALPPAPNQAPMSQKAREPALPPAPNQARMSQEARKPALPPAPNQAPMSQEARKPALPPASNQAPMSQEARKPALTPAPNQGPMSQEAPKPTLSRTPSVDPISQSAGAPIPKSAESGFPAINSQTKTFTKRLVMKMRIPIPCPNVFNPVCAILSGVKSTFSNECLVNSENVKTGKNWQIFSEGVCAEDYANYSPNANRAKKSVHNFDPSAFNFNTPGAELGHDVTYIYSPPIFQTHFIDDYPQPYLNPNSQGFAPLRPRDQTEALYDQAKSFSPFEHYPNPSNMIYTGLVHAPQVTERPVCQYGTKPVCGTFDGETLTFDNVCELMLRNTQRKQTWTVLHGGHCDDCSINCSKDYSPICVTRNGINYTMANECYLKFNICQDKRSIWKMISKGECQSRTKNIIEDKYELRGLGFRFTSNYAAKTYTTANPMTASTNPTTSNATTTFLPTTETTTTKATAGTKLKLSQLALNTSEKPSGFAQPAKEALSTTSTTLIPTNPTTPKRKQKPRRKSYALKPRMKASHKWSKPISTTVPNTTPSHISMAPATTQPSRIPIHGSHRNSHIMRVLRMKAFVPIEPSSKSRANKLDLEAFSFSL